MNLTLEQVENEVKRLANISPDNVYRGSNRFNGPGCSYISGQCDNGSTGCIIGQALSNLGVPESKLRKADANCMSAASLFEELLGGNPIEYSWACHVQGQQDLGSTWETAIQYANAQGKL